MSNHKKKDAAALFELIDKSTLKIPKDAKGGIKIPGWFSSKLNPPGVIQPEMAPEGDELGELDENDPLLPSLEEVQAARAVETGGATAVPEPVMAPSASVFPTSSKPATNHVVASQPTVTVRGATMPNPTPKHPTPSQNHPPTAAVPTPPPAPPAAANPVPRMSMPTGRQNSLKAAIAAANAGMQHRGLGKSGLGAGGGGIDADKRYSFSPLQRTHGPSRWAHPGMLARIPGWIILVSGLALLLVLMGIGFGIRALVNPAPTPTPAAVNGNNGASGSATPVVANPAGNPRGNPPDNGVTAGGNVTPPDNVRVKPIPPVTPVAPKTAPVLPAIIPGKVLPSNSVKRVPNQYYLLILSSPTERIARANAEFLVSQGMSDISVEQKSNGIYIVASVQGFNSNSDPQSDALRKLAVEIGKKHPDAKKQGHSVFYDAYLTKLVHTPR